MIGACPTSYLRRHRKVDRTILVHQPKHVLKRAKWAGDIRLTTSDLDRTQLIPTNTNRCLRHKSLLGLRRAENLLRDFGHARCGGSVLIIEIESSYWRDKADLWIQRICCFKALSLAWWPSL